ncbi:hypothetical protein TNCV_4634761 [Trichonephila clavipes]|nr:hypothetical protein TNCV_4634761 [Trichonephila clavipes]
MDWPARSPDLNPIEHVWDFLGRRLAARTLPPVTIRELRLALQDECLNNSLTPSFSAWADAVPAWYRYVWRTRAAIKPSLATKFGALRYNCKNI